MIEKTPCVGDLLTSLHLEPDILDDVLSLLPTKVVDQLLLVGGQSLKIWADIYLINSLTGDEIAHLTSFDLDLMGSKEAVIQCAEAWHGEPLIPTIDDATPNSGAVRFQLPSGEFVIVDFLRSVYGLDDSTRVFKVLCQPIFTDPRRRRSGLQNGC